ncbi:MAG: glycosyltransferase [Verrucomicrobiae bacterium]|nr:glycosyltransferase [Verrucomicrobiae bacterium]
MRILVATPGHLRTAPMGRYCAETFREMGHDVRLFDCGSLTLSEKFFLRPVAKLRGQNRFEKTRLNRRLLETADEFKPELFLAIFGFDIFPETLAAIRKSGARAVCWWLNDPFQFDRGLALAPAYDLFLSNCASSARRYVHQGVSRAGYLPHAAFLPVHRPIELSAAERRQWESEVCFIGDWGPVRQGILSMLSRKVKLRIWGPWRKHLTPRDRLWSSITDGFFTADDMARALSSAKAAINLHSWFGYYECGLNPRTFETPACGAFQLCDWKEDLAQHYQETKEIITYHTGAELELKLIEFLRDDAARRQIAESARQRTLAEHSYPRRMRQLLEMI